MEQQFNSLFESPLGLIEIKATDKAVTHISFVENETAPAYSNNICLEAEGQLRAYFAGEQKMFDFPFVQNGTPFQQQVWRLLYQIPYGKTISYRDLTKQYGDVKTIPAVAAAKGRNNLAIVVPCHRVIGSNATLTGYAGGLWRKKWLLDHEAKFHSGVQQLFG